jgi:hypothetical protein
MTSGNEDWEMWLRLIEAGWTETRVEEPLFRYRKHGVSMSVTTEGRFEEGRRMVRDRHLESYRPDALRDAKRLWYPLLTIVGESNPLPDEAELVPSAEGLKDTWGKYVVDLRGAEGAISGTSLLQLADLLETNPQAALARSIGQPPLTVLRRWNLHDPEAEPEGEVVLDDQVTGPVPLEPGSVPRPGWFIPQVGLDPGIPIQRQRPEETASLPDPERW